MRSLSAWILATRVFAFEYGSIQPVSVAEFKQAASGTLGREPDCGGIVRQAVVDGIIAAD